MQRTTLSYLKTWLVSEARKPLIIRGARQVGKTWLVRHFANISGKQLIEVNFEKQPAYLSLFQSNDPAQILFNLSAAYNQALDPDRTLLFLDEIQAAPQILAKLRWFAEDMPQLPLVAAGSLLEFVLSNHTFSMPVGRISYMHLEPLSFEEFLSANNQKMLVEYLSTYDLSQVMPDTIHIQLLSFFKEYILVGGMPAVTAAWVARHNLSEVNQMQHDLLATYRDDFAKYKGRIAVERLDEVMMAVPKMLGQKFIFSRVNTSIQANTVKQVLDLLSKARICHRAWSSAANGVPLAAEIKEKYFKAIFIDTGLCSAALGFNFNQINANNIMMINQGGIAEQIVGQILRTIYPPYIEPALYCWHREEVGSSAEIDYLIQHNHTIIPIEVKAGSTGGLKSLHLFMGLKKLKLAVRINSDLPTKTSVSVQNKQVNYTLLSIPFYLTGQLPRLLAG